MVKIVIQNYVHKNNIYAISIQVWFLWIKHMDFIYFVPSIIHSIIRFKKTVED
jgi:hypothetical protein